MDKNKLGTVSNTSCLNNEPHVFKEFKYNDSNNTPVILSWCQHCGIIEQHTFYGIGPKINIYCPTVFDKVDDEKEETPEPPSNKKISEGSSKSGIWKWFKDKCKSEKDYYTNNPIW